MSQKNIDYDLEGFYLNFKQSMINFYQHHTFKRPIQDWSDRLNILQGFKNYTEIRNIIIKIISLYAIDLMRSCDQYHSNILDTNIKRFNRTTQSSIYEDLKSISYDTNIVFLLFDIFKSLLKNNDIENIKPLFIQVELYILYEDYTPIIRYAVNNNKHMILDKLFKFSLTIFNFALKMYNIPLNTPVLHKTRNTIVSGRKFMDLINN